MKSTKHQDKMFKISIAAVRQKPVASLNKQKKLKQRLETFIQLDPEVIF